MRKIQIVKVVGGENEREREREIVGKLNNKCRLFMLASISSMITIIDQLSF